ncbi:alpha/beta fold hydrolase [Nocardia asteroides]|uniref:alpha/beta fold hydrolase n=1 Tax=Nocardia asteroides TaxID=1824 RepID=UPI001E523310|nr:alpha/beta hydrolase [Nocardia asteroides]UGT54764.1 alpha/beta hydrolase [Nocardia asteroides]
MRNRGDIGRFETGDGVLAYRDTGGGGRPVILLHAGFLDSGMFDRQLTGLRRRHRVIAPDARGHGESDNATRPFRAADDVAALLQHLDLTSVVVAGVSMGAMTAVDLAIEYPHLVAGLMVSGRGIGDPDYRQDWSRELQWTQTDALARGDLNAWLDAFTRWAVGPYRRADELDNGLLCDLRRSAAHTMAKHTASEQDFTVAVPDVAARAQLISAPVLAVDGALDSPELTATVDKLLAVVPRGRRTTIEGAGHFPNLEQPVLYNTLVEHFIDQVDSTAHHLKEI